MSRPSNQTVDAVYPTGITGRKNLANRFEGVNAYTALAESRYRKRLKYVEQIGNSNHP
jgi:hypothetical protein